MALTQKTRPETLIVAWRRDAGGQIATAACLTELVELHDDVAGTIEAVREIPAVALNVADVAGIVGDQLAPLIAERDAAIADKATALEAAADDKARALTAAAADKAQALGAAGEASAAALAVLQARIDQLTAPPAVPSIDMVAFKLALLQTPSFLNPGKTLLDDANALVAASPMNVQLLWTSARVARDNPVLNQMAPLLVPAASDPAQALDQLFALAPTLIPA